MKQEDVQAAQQPTPTPTPDPQPQPKKKAKRQETLFDGAIGNWQRLLAPLVENSAQLPQLEIPRSQLAEIVSQAAALKKQQAAHLATKQDFSQQLRTTMSNGRRLAALLRQSLRQIYGPSSEKLNEFGIQPFRGRGKNAPAGGPGPGIPGPEVVAHPPATPPTPPKPASDPANRS